MMSHRYGKKKKKKKKRYVEDVVPTTGGSQSSESANFKRFEQLEMFRENAVRALKASGEKIIQIRKGEWVSWAEFNKIIRGFEIRSIKKNYLYRVVDLDWGLDIEVIMECKDKNCRGKYRIVRGSTFYRYYKLVKKRV